VKQLIIPLTFQHYFTLRKAAKLSIAPDRTSSKSNTSDSNIGKRSLDVASSPM